MTHRPDYLVKGERPRLIPVAADSRRESRAASVLLATLCAVHEFRQSLLASLGMRVGSRAQLVAWTEITFTEQGEERPDGLLILNTGKKQWKALVEAKIGNAELEAAQIKSYMQQAKQYQIDAVITISNQFVALPSHPPVPIPKTLLRSTELYHWSWMYIVTQATLLLNDEAITSPDQRFILEEALRFYTHDSSGVSSFDRMNKEWREVVTKIQSGAPLNKNSGEIENTVSYWHQEQRDLCLMMSREIGSPVQLKLPRAHRSDPIQRLRDDCAQLVQDKRLTCTLMIPNAASDIEVTANLMTRTITCAMRVTAPQDRKRESGRVNWLTRQLQKAEGEGLYLKVIRPGRAEETQAPLSEVLRRPEVLESQSSAQPPSAFEVFYLVDLAGRFSGNKVFIEALEKIVPYFYEQVGQRLRAWVPPPPKIHREEATAALDEREEEKGVEAQVAFPSTHPKESA